MLEQLACSSAPQSALVGAVAVELTLPPAATTAIPCTTIPPKTPPPSTTLPWSPKTVFSPPTPSLEFRVLAEQIAAAEVEEAEGVEAVEAVIEAACMEAAEAAEAHAAGLAEYEQNRLRELEEAVADAQASRMYLSDRLRRSKYNDSMVNEAIYLPQGRGFYYSPHPGRFDPTFVIENSKINRPVIAAHTTYTTKNHDSPFQILLSVIENPNLT